jgi:N-acetylmuramoyl-L-alanine amidase
MTTMPSILIEIGFISNPAEEKYLNSKQGQDNIANAIFQACREYIEEADKRSGISAVKQEEKIVNTDSVSKTDGLAGKIIFMVQVVSSTKKIETKPENFRNLTDITEIQAGNRYRYFTGKFTDYDKAVSYRKQVERIYPDAFVVAVKENKILPLQEALREIKRK